MDVFRIARHERNFTIIDNDLLRDQTLSFRATGLLAYMLSMPPGWEPTGRELGEVKTEGRDAVFKALREIEIAGYLVRTREHGADGHWVHVSTIYESLADARSAEANSCANPVEPPCPGNQDLVSGTTSGFPGPGYPDPDSQDIKAKEQPKEVLEKRKKNTFSSVVTPRSVALGRELCILLSDLMVANGCRTTYSATSAAGEGDEAHAWEYEAELMIRSDGRDPAEAADLIRWVQADSFWKANVLSLSTFRAKYDQLRLARESRKAPSPWAKVDRTNRNPDNIAPRDAPGRVHAPAHLSRNGAAMLERLDALVGQSS